MNGYIYKITNPEGKVYIGQTINLNKRIGNYKNPRKNWNTAIAISIRNNGWELHTFEIIEECLVISDKELLNLREIYWINYYDSFNNGLNSTIGGNGTYGYKHTDEHKKKISKLFINRQFSEETRSKISKSLKGIIRSEEHNVNNRLSHIGKISNKRIKVKCIDNGIIYDSIMEAASILDICSQKISMVCKGKRNTTGGFRFEYV